MNVGYRFKIKIVILLVFTLFGYFFGISTINSNISDLRSKRTTIRNINTDILLLNSIYSRIYLLDDQITLGLISNKSISREYNHMEILQNGISIFSKNDSLKIDSLFKLKMDNVLLYGKDTIGCNDLSLYYKTKFELNSQIRIKIRSLVVRYLEENNKNLESVLDEYERSYFKYIIFGSSMIIIFTFMGILLLKDMIILIRTNYRTNTTIDNLLRYIKDQKDDYNY